jgi:pimeloyl-ACP methyl ester carboxylesterase
MNVPKKVIFINAGNCPVWKAKHTFIMFAAILLISLSGNRGIAQTSQNLLSQLNGEKTTWHGFDRYDFIMDEETFAITPSKSLDGEGSGVKDPVKGQRRCIVVAPKQAAPGNTWSWRGCYWDHQPQTEIELLSRGFHVAYISANQDLKPDKRWDAWYEFLTAKLGLSPKPAFIGMSRGGEYSYIWATRHPDKVSCIYADNPGGNWEIMKGIAGLAMNDVPILHVCGSIDPILGMFSLPIENIYHQFGGRISTMIKEGFGHHPHSLHNPKIIADFIEQSVKEAKPALPDFANEKSTRKSYYSTIGTFSNYPEEGAFITCRGPLFTECYNRYEVEIKGVEAFTTIIAPKNAAPGKPWVFRAGFVNWDATVDQALLAKGYHIVTGAVPYNADGPIISQWNTIYKYLTDRGFSEKAVMEGCGGAAGEAYAWAIENPDKVSCIYGENPILHSKLAKIQPIDNLAPLANAKIPVLHVCGATDPLLATQTRETEKRYKALGGKITVILKAGEGHYLLSPEDPKPVVDFIIKGTK